MSGRASRPLRPAIAMLAIAAVLVAFGEVLCRLALPPPVRYEEPQVFYRRVEGPLGWEMLPRQRSYTQNVAVTTNSLGLRDREFAVPRPPEAFRVLALGDSLTFGVGVPAEATWAKRLERELADGLDGRTVEVVNAGVEAYWTRQEVELLRSVGVALEPDVVVLGFYWNDFPQIGRPDAPLGVAGAESGAKGGATQAPGEPSWSAVDDDGHIGSRSAIPLLVRRVLKASRLLFASKQAFERLGQAVDPPKEALWRDAILEGRTTPRMDESFARVRTALEEAKRLGDEHGFPLVLATFPIPEQVFRERPTSLYPSRVLEIARELAIPSIDLLPALRDSDVSPARLFIPWDGHPSAASHRVAARTIAERLRAMPWRSVGNRPPTASTPVAPAASSRGEEAPPDADVPPPGESSKSHVPRAAPKGEGR